MTARLPAAIAAGRMSRLSRKRLSPSLRAASGWFETPPQERPASRGLLWHGGAHYG
jgi:hypothetical protein